MKLYELVDSRIAEAFGELGFPLEAAITSSSTHEGVDRQCNAAMAIAKARDTNPRVLADQITALLKENPAFASVEVAGPGFINLLLSDRAIIDSMMASPILSPDQRQHIILDFGGPNVAKALHVGHLRSLVIGESLRRILKACGHHVISDVHLGDWGLPMGMLISELAEQPNIPEPLADYLERTYPGVVRACQNDSERMQLAQQATSALQKGEPHATELWQMIRDASLHRIRPNVERLGAHFDVWGGESNAQHYLDAVLQALRETGAVRVDDGATIVDVVQPADNKPMPPIIFTKADEGFTYAATDLATIFGRSLFPLPQRILYVVDNRQALHFEQVFRAARKLPQCRKTEFVHVGFGTVNGTDGKPFKTRAGGVPTLDSMLEAAVERVRKRTSKPANAEMIGIGAVKFADLITQREKGYIFDIDRMVEPEGKTGPYVQYACVRIKSILRDADETYSNAPILFTHWTERALALACANFPEAVALAEKHLSPTFVADYAFRLARQFSLFYADCPVLPESDTTIRLSRLALCHSTLERLTVALDLLGIGVPPEM